MSALEYGWGKQNPHRNLEGKLLENAADGKIAHE
jgi:hypothetical protein